MINQSDRQAEKHAEKQGEKGGSPCFTPVSVLVNYSKRWNESEERQTDLMKVLCYLVTEKPEQAEAGFTSREIIASFKKALGRGWVFSEPESKTVSRYWKKLDKLMEKKRAGLLQHLISLGLDTYPVLIRTNRGGGAGNESRYSIALRTIDPADITTPSTNHNETDQGHIQYICEDVEGLRNLLTRRWRLQGVLFILLLLAVVFFFYILFVVGMSSNIFSAGQTLLLLVFGLIIPAGLWSYFGYLLVLPKRRITPLSSMLQSMDNSLLVEFRQSSDQRKEIKLVKYSGECPICGGRVTAQSGGLEFFGRIVGKCETAPVEHIFSFDHITRKGKSLR